MSLRLFIFNSKSLIILLLTAIATTVEAVAFAEPADTVGLSYRPEFRGVVRGRYELLTNSMENRFQVRDARMYVQGMVAPTVDYKVECLYSSGNFQLLYAWGRIAVAKNFKITLGQQRYPFGVDVFHSAFNYVFANRSFLGKQVGNFTGVGMKLSYSLPSLPLTIDGGVFNHYRSAQQNVWQKKMDYAAKATYKAGNVTFAAGVESVLPDSVRINMIDAAVTWRSGRWTVEGEFVNKHYTGGSFADCRSYNFWANYSLPVNFGIFNRLSFQGRWDGMTDHSDGKRDKDNRLTLTDNARNRLTLGATMGYIHPRVETLVRLNYENYFYSRDVAAPVGQDDKIVAELVVIF